MRSFLIFCHVICVVALTVVPASVEAAPDAETEIRAAYQRFYAGDADTARRDFERLVAASPQALPARFGLLTVLRQQSDLDRTLERDFERAIDRFITDSESRYDRSRQDDEALFYLANAHSMRAVYRYDHEKGIWGAARDGARSKGLIETYVKRHPEHGDAYYALGMYNYYVEIAPSFIKLLRPLLFLPSGNRAEGIRQLERAYTQGDLFAAQAGLRLVEIYGSLEGRPAEGVRVGERLTQAYPDSSVIQFQLASLYLGPAVASPAKAAAQYEKVITSESRRPEPRAALYEARLGLASALSEQWRLDDSVRVLTATIDANPSTPPWVMPAFLLRRAVFRTMADDDRAVDDVKRVLGDARWKEHHKSADALGKQIASRRASGEAAIYTRLIAGNRLVAERKWDEAAAAYEPVRRQWPNDPQVRYRLAVLQFARGDNTGAAAAASALAATRNAPASIRAESLLIVARVDDLAGRRDAAKKSYNRIVDDYETENAVWPARVGLVTPYRRP